MLHLNTTNETKIETLTLKGQEEGGGDLTESYELEPEMFRIEAAGRMVLHVPTFDKDDPFGLELFAMRGAFSMEISKEGMEVFAKADIELGPEEVRLLDVDALGVLIINDKGIAGDIQVTVGAGNIAAIKDWFDFEVSARVVFNTANIEQEVAISDRFLPYLTPEFIATLTPNNNPPDPRRPFKNASSYKYVVDNRPPVRPDGIQGPEGSYIVIDAKGKLEIAKAFRVNGDFYFQLDATPSMFITANASMALDPLGAVTASGTLYIDRTGVYGGLQLGGSLELGPVGIFGAAQLEFNSTPVNAEIIRYKYDFDERRVTDERERLLMTPGTFRIHVAGYMGIEGSFELKGEFFLENRTDVVAISVDASFQAFGASLLYVDGDAYIVKKGDKGLVAKLVASIQSPIQIPDIFELEASFLLEINTRGGEGSDAYDLGTAFWT
jgi:hypothetical protein